MNIGWKEVLKKGGVVGLIACGLVYWLALTIDAKLDTIKNTVFEHVLTSNFYLRAICLNTATTPVQQANCIPPAERDFYQRTVK